jgi:hypothetical protein
MDYLEYQGREILFREAVLGFLGANKKETTSKVSSQRLGHYCKGKDIIECRSYFGEELINICATCPQ